MTFSLIPRPSVQSGNLPGLILNPLSCNFLGCKLEMYRREFRYKHIASVSQTCKHWCSHKYFLRKGYLLPVYTSHTDISFCWHTYLPGQHPVDWGGATHTSSFPGESGRRWNPYHPASRGIHYNSWGSCCWRSETKLLLGVYLLCTPHTSTWFTDTTCHPLLVTLPCLRLTPSSKRL